MSAHKIRILLIEDNPGDVRLIQEMLLGDRRQRIDLDTAAALHEGLRQIEQQDYDLILLDLSLPDAFGMDTLLKVQTEAHDTAIVVLTGIDDQSLGIQALQNGAQDYLPKGDVDSKLLIRSIRYAIERQATEAALRHSEEEYRSLIDDVFDTSNVGVIILDRDFSVVWCNEATEVYFGIDRNEILGHDKRQLITDKLKCIFAYPEVYAERLLDAYSRQDFTDRFECHILPGLHREERWLVHWSQPIRSGVFQSGRIEQYMDITARKQLENAEHAQREFAEALRDTATLLTSTLDLDDVLERILNNLYRVVPHDAAAITMLEDDHVWVARTNDESPGNARDIIAERELHVEYAYLLRQMLETRRPLLVDNLQDEDQFKNTAKEANVRAYVGAPIQLQKRVIGFINVFSTQRGFFDALHAERLLVFAEQAAIAIQNAQLFEQSKELATPQERQRLARELHDSVSQTLFTCRTMSESALRRWEKDPHRAHELLAEVNQLTTTALSEMRVLLLELRPAALTQLGLKELFEQYLRPIQERRRFQLKMALDEMAPLPPDVQIALYRIAQEALNNIDKHAQARTVEICAVDYPEYLELTIRDDGHGFDIAEAPASHLGLRIMQERAAAIGASLQIKSLVGQGTEITVDWKKRDENE